MTASFAGAALATALNTCNSTHHAIWLTHCNCGCRQIMSQKRPIYLSKETCIHVKMSLSLERESWFCAGSCASENYSERESHSQRESGSCDSLESKETYIHVKRDLYTCQKRPVYMSKYRERERVGLAQALARERVTQRESERVTLRERVRESLSERETLKKVNMGWLRL